MKRSDYTISTAARQNDELAHHRIVSQEEWTRERIVLLEKEKQAMKLQDELSRQQRALPWVKVEKQYLFTTPEGDVTLTDLFDGRSQLFIKHFMMGPQQDWQCQGCSLEVDHVGGLLVHMEHHDMSYVAVARAPIEEIEAVRKRMGWTFRWVSSSKSDFNYDYHVSFTPEEAKAHKAYYNYREFDPKESRDFSGDSVFYRNPEGQIFHTYSTFGRGGEQFLGIYRFFDVLPKGREENGPNFSLPDWACVRDRYEKNGGGCGGH
jgi:predicted dithiol-disulfide oxidoreductase (DUF899 family)